MIVMKFGGTSVGSAERIAATADIVASCDEPVVVVLSAMSGVTNMLIEAARGERPLSEVAQRHYEAARQLGLGTEYHAVVDSTLGRAAGEAETVACGELLSTALARAYMQTRGMDAVMLPALDFMRLNADGTPDTAYIARAAAAAIERAGRHRIYVTQGFICRDAGGSVATLTRGGSDYTATLLGEALRASHVCIWTDVDGVYSADPRHVPAARCIPRMSYAQADMAARLGAKILHSDCIVPAQRCGAEVRVLDSFHPEAAGTVVGPFADAPGFIAVAASADHVGIVGHDAAVAAADIARALGPLAAAEPEIHAGHTRVSVQPGQAVEAMRIIHHEFIENKI